MLVESVNILWLLPAAVTLHMIEEIIWLPAWSQTAGFWHGPVRWGQFAFASAVLVGLTFVLTWAAVRSGRESVAVYLAMGLALTMLINVVYPHVGATIHLGRYGPGLVTGLFINLPVMSFLLWWAVREAYITGPTFLLAAGPMLLAAAAGWLLLLYTGSILLQSR
jgi:hypothetical protein